MYGALSRRISLLLMVVSPICAAEPEDAPLFDRFVTHYAGMLGMISLGVENAMGSHADYQMLAGYTPASEAGVDIYSLGIRANYAFEPFLNSKVASARIYTGIGFYYYFGEQYRSYDYPDGYYTHPATEWHLMPYLGVRLSDIAPLERNITLYAEAGIIDAYLIHYYNNSDTLRLSDAVSLAIGASIPLH